MGTRRPVQKNTCFLVLSPGRWVKKKAQTAGRAHSEGARGSSRGCGRALNFVCCRREKARSNTLIYCIKNISRTSAVSSTNFRSILTPSKQRGGVESEYDSFANYERPFVLDPPIRLVIAPGSKSPPLHNSSRSCSSLERCLGITKKNSVLISAVCGDKNPRHHNSKQRLDQHGFTTTVDYSVALFTHQITAHSTTYGTQHTAQKAQHKSHEAHAPSGLSGFGVHRTNAFSSRQQ